MPINSDPSSKVSAPANDVRKPLEGTQVPFLGLPNELLDKIVSNCDRVAAVNLLCTNRRFFDQAQLLHSSRELRLSKSDIEFILEKGKLVSKDITAFKTCIFSKRVTDEQIMALVQNGHLRTMEAIDLSGCRNLTEKCLPALLSLPCLKKLDLSSCLDISFAKVDSHLFSNSMRFLTIQKISEIDMAALFSCFPKLQHLDAAQVLDLSNVQHINNDNIQNLQHLALSVLPINVNELAGFINKTKKLREVILNSYFEESIALPLNKERLQSLRQISFRRVSNIEIIQDCADLHRLHLYGCKLNNQTIAAINAQANLKTLHLEYCLTDDSQLAQLNLSKLDTLVVSNNKKIAVPFRGLHHMKELRVNDCHPPSDDEMLRFLERSPDLVTLEVNAKHLTMTSLKKIVQLPKLTSLALVSLSKDTGSFVNDLCLSGLKLKHLGLESCHFLSVDNVEFIADRFSELQSLSLKNCIQLDQKVLMLLASRLPLLENLDLSQLIDRRVPNYAEVEAFIKQKSNLKCLTVDPRIESIKPLNGLRSLSRQLKIS